MRLVDYTLVKRATLRDLRGGRLSRQEVCDAHPELLRAARNVGDRSVEECACYVVEVCTECFWNHLTQCYLLGRRHAG